MTTKAYAVVGITKEEFLQSGGNDTEERIRKALDDVFHASMARAAHDTTAVKTDMVVRFSDPMPGLEQYHTFLFINRPAQQECERAGIKLTILCEIDEGDVPESSGRSIDLPLYLPTSVS